MPKKLTIIFILLCNFQVFAGQSGQLIYINNGIQQNIAYAEIDGLAIAEGDIILKEIKSSKNKLDILPQAVMINKIHGARWEDNVMPFKISNNFDASCQYNILDAMATWEEKTHLKFIELTPKNISQYKDYAYFIPSFSKTSASYVGRQGGKQIIKISTSCKKMTIAHEIGHALGLWHEQSRADRDKHIKIIWDNIDAKHVFNFKQHLSDGADIGEYDYSSVMHYSAYAFSKNGKRTIEPIYTGEPIGQRKKLSKKDIAAINYVYPKVYPSQ